MEKWEAIVSRAFQRERDVLAWQGFQRIQCQCRGTGHQSREVQPPCRRIDGRSIVMGDAKELVIRRDPGIQCLPRRQVVDCILGRGWYRRRLICSGDNLAGCRLRQRTLGKQGEPREGAAPQQVTSMHVTPLMFFVQQIAKTT